VKVAEMEFGDKCIWTEVMEIDHRWFGFTCMRIARAPTGCLFGWLASASWGLNQERILVPH
jgi:hypothetical protein